MVLFYGLSAAANAFVVLQPIILAYIVNTLQKGGETMVADALLWCGAYAGAILAFWGLHGPSRVIERRVAFTVYRSFVSSLYRKVTELPLRWHADHHTGDTINRVTKAGKALFKFAGEQFIPIGLSVRFVGSLVFLALYSWWVAAVAFAVSFGLYLVIRRYDRIIIPLVGVVNDREHRLTAGVFDYIGNIITVLTLRLQKETQREIRRRFLAMRHPFWCEGPLTEGKWATVSIILVLMQAGQVGAYIVYTLWSGEQLLIGSVVAIFQYQLIINQIFYQGMLSAEQIMRSMVDFRSIEPVLEDHRRLGDPVIEEKPQAWERIDIRGLNFAHHEGENAPQHLDNIHLAFHAGQKIALVGASGAGKSTLLALMRSFYEARNVRLLIDNDSHDTLKPLASFTTLIPQDAEIFENTILYNLTLGINVPEAEVNEALHVTTFDDVIAQLPDGIETDIRERGVNLSGGQKQRLALARGLLAARESSLLLLDEPTSSVDMETESVIFDRLFAAMPDKTIIASIHRLHLLPRFDWICLIRGGAIVQQGTFLDLIAAKGPFLTLWQQHLAYAETPEDIDEEL